MKKPAIIIMLLLLLSMKTTGFAYTEDELEQLASIVMTNGLHITYWDVTLKEKVSINKALKMVEKLEQDHMIALEENEDSLKYMIQFKNEGNLSERYEVIIPKANKNVEYAHVNVVIYGSGWDEKIQVNYKNKVMSLKRHVFSQFARKYVCLYTTNNAIIKTVDSIIGIKQELGLIHTSTQVDTEEQSTYERIIYGYTPLWQQVIQIDNEPMNVQIVVKQTNNNEMNLMIGTPILLNEY